MTRLADAGIVTLTWSEDAADGSVYGEGHQSYEIDEANELVIFHGPKCVRIAQCVDFPHAVSMVIASEAVCSQYIRQGGDGLGNKVNEHGWVLK